MCGIFGWLPASSHERADIPAVARTLSEALAHRGPDDQGWLALGRDGSVLASECDVNGLTGACSALLGQTRLSIIDLSQAGHQPMRSPDGRYTLVYNGEIYNYLELRAELEDKGVHFTSHTDSEVLLHALICWGAACLHRLTGMFAFALYDALERSLFCARDIFGIKPFHYHAGGAGFAFASEIPALLRVPGVPHRPDARQVYTYLASSVYDAGGTTFFADVFRLPPAHSLTLSLDAPAAVRLERYWESDLAAVSSLSFAQAAEYLRELFLDSMRLHLRADVPLGVALSGGIDSSAVTCAVRRLEPDAELHTFSFVAKGSPVSEEHWADIVARHVRAVRHVIVVEPQELMRDVDAMVRCQGEPFGSTSIYAQYRVFQLARDAGVKVTLDGQGADELLAGYNSYIGRRLESLLTQGRPFAAWRFIRASAAWPGRSQSALLRQAIRHFLPGRALAFLRCATRSEEGWPAWLDMGRFRDEGVMPMECGAEERGVGTDLLRQTLVRQLAWSGLQALLRHGDRNAMAFSIESRVPFLTREIAEFCLSLPEEYLISLGGETKSVFRAAMRGLVPDVILDRRDKIGFATPECDWLRALSPWITQTLENAHDVPYLNIPAVRREWRTLAASGADFDWRVWRWINYVRWIECFATG